ncbi:MAG: hypothetical protein OJF49_001538 [Ktedonobacterales bacterium]|jgi:hypothetical protein|nr:MAG: hypothetical protein OJF49_001538 [Ktedonobacterales bacterium]
MIGLRANGIGSRRVCAALLMLLTLAMSAGCAIGPTAKGTPQPTARPTFTPTLIPTATSTPSGPMAATAMLGAAPTSCPEVPQVETMNFPQGFRGFQGSVTLYGGGPAWIPGAYFPRTIHLNGQGFADWPVTKVIWEIGPDFSDPVTAQVMNLETGEVAWWVRDTPPTFSTQTLVLDVNIPSPAMDHGASEPGWHAWGSSLLLTRAGCYSMVVAWQGGEWRTVFAAGR